MLFNWLYFGTDIAIVANKRTQVWTGLTMMNGGSQTRVGWG